MDVNRFIHEREGSWRELETLLDQVERRGAASLGVEGARRFGKLYRAASSDLIRARTAGAEASLVDYLNGLVARSYAYVYGGGAGRGRAVLEFFVRGFPRLFREEWKAVALSASLFAAGSLVGAAGQTFDPSAEAVLIPEDHQVHTPTERVADEEAEGTAHRADKAAAFSTFLFTHNIKVSFLVFALGITAGLGTSIVLFANGLPLGALAVQYHQHGEGTFFWAWILPHGIPEITEIVIAGAAGLILARGILFPGRRRRVDALRHDGGRAVRLALGGMPILVLAGLIEGTISQIHEPVIPYALKLVFAAIVGAGVYAFLLFAGRSPTPTSEPPAALAAAVHTSTDAKPV